MKVDFNYETDFKLVSELKYTDWINRMVSSEESFVGNLSYVFCDDNYLNKINVEYLNHDTYTDIITFDYSDDHTISGDIFISIERVKDNAIEFRIDFSNELLRVMSHGILHLLGYNDKSENERQTMRSKEEEMIKMFHVEQ